MKPPDLVLDGSMCAILSNKAADYKAAVDQAVEILDLEGYNVARLKQVSVFLDGLRKTFAGIGRKP